MSYHRDRSVNERVGAAVLLPFKLIGWAVAAVILVLVYPFNGMYILLRGEGDIKTRLVTAATWPLGILAMNDFMSLGGMNNPTLSKISAGLGKVWHKTRR